MKNWRETIPKEGYDVQLYYDGNECDTRRKEHMKGPDSNPQE